MEQDIELLEYIYQNAEMGIIILESLLKVVRGDEMFIKALRTQLLEYREISEKATKLKQKLGVDIKGNSRLSVMSAKSMIKLKTMCDKSTSHIASMLVVGSNMGVVNAIRTLKEHTLASSEVRNLMHKLKTSEENNIENMKEYI